MTSAAADLASIPVVDESQLRIIGADTIEYAETTYRLAGFDAPESRGGSDTEKSLARIACFRLAWLLGPHQSRIIRPIRKKDKYGRTVAQLLINGEDVAVTAVREGWGTPYTKGKRASWSSTEVLAAHLERLEGDPR